MKLFLPPKNMIGKAKKREERKLRFISTKKRVPNLSKLKDYKKFGPISGPTYA